MCWHQLSTLRGLYVPLVLLAGVGLVAGHACREPAQKAPQAAAPALKTPRQLDVLAGTVPLEVEGDGLEVRIDGKSVDVTQWFAHVRLLNPEKVAGRETAFTVRAFTFR